MRLPKPINLILALAFFLPAIAGSLWGVHAHARDVADAKAKSAEIQQLKNLQVQELATFNLLKDTIEKFSGPRALAAQRAATESFLNELMTRTEVLDQRLLDAIQSGNRVIVTTRTRTVCRTPSGKAC